MNLASKVAALEQRVRYRPGGNDLDDVPLAFVVARRFERDAVGRPVRLVPDGVFLHIKQRGLKGWVARGEDEPESEFLHRVERIVAEGAIWPGPMRDSLPSDERTEALHQRYYAHEGAASAWFGSIEYEAGRPVRFQVTGCYPHEPYVFGRERRYFVREPDEDEAEFLSRVEHELGGLA